MWYSGCRKIVLHYSGGEFEKIGLRSTGPLRQKVQRHMRRAFLHEFARVKEMGKPLRCFVFAQTKLGAHQAVGQIVILREISFYLLPHLVLSVPFGKFAVFRFLEMDIASDLSQKLRLGTEVDIAQVDVFAGQLAVGLFRWWRVADSGSVSSTCSHF